MPEQDIPGRSTASTPALRDLRGAMSSPETDLVPLFLLKFDNARTRRAYRTDLASFFGTGTVPLEAAREVTFVHVNRYLDDLSAGGRSPATVRRRMAAIRGFYDWLDALGLVSDNPTKRPLVRRLPRAKPTDSPVLVLTPQQAGALIDAAADDDVSGVRDSTLILVLLHLVLRRSEAAAMDVEHLRPIGAHTVLDLPDTKGGRNQYVKVPEHVARVIAEHCAHYGISSGPVWRSHSRSSRGHRLTPHSIYRIVRTAALAAGLPGIGAHTLRHTGCTLAIEAGATLQQVQSHARHKKLETTMVYVHQRDRLRDSAADYIQVSGPRKD